MTRLLANLTSDDEEPTVYANPLGRGAMVGEVVYEAQSPEGDTHDLGRSRPHSRPFATTGYGPTPPPTSTTEVTPYPTFSSEDAPIGATHLGSA